MSETDIDPVISYIIIKQPMINFDFCGIINHIADKCMARCPAFQPPTIFQIFAIYNIKRGPIPKSEPID